MRAYREPPVKAVGLFGRGGFTPAQPSQHGQLAVTE
jgi:hypothetical protein